VRVRGTAPAFVAALAIALAASDHRLAVAVALRLEIAWSRPDGASFVIDIARRWSDGISVVLHEGACGEHVQRMEFLTMGSSDPNGVTSPMRLSERERQVVALAIAGYENKEIAHELGLAYSTVRVLMARAARKIGARGRREIVESASVLPDERVESPPPRTLSGHSDPLVFPEREGGVRGPWRSGIR
jgi:DNA-binding CsgD family transcriptional regulator